MQSFHTPSSRIYGSSFVVWFWLSELEFTCSSSYTSWLYLSGFFPHLETAEALDARFEPVDWERSGHREGIGSRLSLEFLLLHM
jgi:hypothetical protein